MSYSIEEEELDESFDRLSLAELYDLKYGQQQAHTEAGPEKRGLGEDFKEKDRELNNNNNNNNNEDTESNSTGDSNEESKEEKKDVKKVRLTKQIAEDKPQFTQNDNSSGRTYLVTFDPQEPRLHRFDYYSDDDDAEINAIEADYKNMQATEGMVEKVKASVKKKPPSMSNEKWYDQESPKLEREVKTEADTAQRKLFTSIQGNWPALKQEGVMNKRKGVSVGVVERLNTLNVKALKAPQDAHSLENLTFLLRVTPFLMQIESELEYLDSYLELCQRGVNHLKWLMLLIDSDEGAALFEKVGEVVPFLTLYYNKYAEESDMGEQTKIGKEGYFAFVMEIYKMWALMFEWKNEIPKLARFAFNELSLVCKGNKTVLAKNPPRVSLLKRQYRRLRLYDLEWMFSFQGIVPTTDEFRNKLKKVDSYKFKGVMKQDYKDLNLLYTDEEEKSGLELLIDSYDYSEQTGVPMYQCWVPWQSYAIFIGFEDFAKEITRLLQVNSLDESVWDAEKKDPQPVDLTKPELEMQAQGHNRTSYMLQFAYSSFEELNGLLAEAVLTVDKLLLGVNRQRINESNSYVFSVFRSISHDRGRAIQVNADLFPKIKTTYFGARRDNVNFDLGIEAWFVMAESYALYNRFALLYLPLLVRIVNVLKVEYKPKEVNFTEMIVRAAVKQAKQNKSVMKDSEISADTGKFNSNEEVVKGWLDALNQIELDDAVIPLQDARDLLKEMYELAAEDGILALGKQQLLTEHIYNAYKVLSDSLPGDSEEAQFARSELEKARIFREGWYALIGRANRQLIEHIGSLFMSVKPEIAKMDLITIVENYKKLRHLIQEHQAIANRLKPVIQEEHKSRDPDKLKDYWKKAKRINFPENLFQQYSIATKNQIKVAKKEKTEAAKDQFMYNAYKNLYFLQIERKLDPSSFSAEEWNSSEPLRAVKDFLLTQLPHIFSRMPEERETWMNAFSELQRRVILARESKAPREVNQTLDRVRDLLNDVFRQIALANGRFASSSELDWDQLASLIGIRSKQRNTQPRRVVQDEETKDEVALRLIEMEEPSDADLNEDLEEDGADIAEDDYAPMVDEDNLQQPDFMKQVKQSIIKELPFKGPPILPMIQRKQNKNDNRNNVNRADSLPKLEQNNNSLSLVPFTSTITEVKTPDDEVARLIREMDLVALTTLARSNRQGSKAAEAWLADNYPMALNNNAMYVDSNSPLISEDDEPSNNNNNNQMID